MSTTGLNNYWTLADVELTDIPGNDPDDAYDVREAITLTFHPSDLVETPEGMLPAQATELAMAIMDAASAWREKTSALSLLPEGVLA